MRKCSHFKNCFMCNKELDNYDVKWCCHNCWNKYAIDGNNIIKSYNKIEVPDHIPIDQEEQYWRLKYVKNKKGIM